MKKGKALALYAVTVAALTVRMLPRMTVPAGQFFPAAQGECVQDTQIPGEYQEYCREIGGRYSICPELLEAMIERESGGDAWASNKAGDCGLLQVNRKWHGDRMRRLGITDLYDPYSNILAAADYLAELSRQDGDLYLALMKYNMNHDTAEKLYRQGNYSAYAVEVAERACELERLHGQEGGTQ